ETDPISAAAPRRETVLTSATQRVVGSAAAEPGLVAITRLATCSPVEWPTATPRAAARALVAAPAREPEALQAAPARAVEASEVAAAPEAEVEEVADGGPTSGSNTTSPCSDASTTAWASIASPTTAVTRPMWE